MFTTYFWWRQATKPLSLISVLPCCTKWLLNLAARKSLGPVFATHRGIPYDSLRATFPVFLTRHHQTLGHEGDATCVPTHNYNKGSASRQTANAPTVELPCACLTASKCTVHGVNFDVNVAMNDWVLLCMRDCMLYAYSYSKWNRNCLYIYIYTVKPRG